MRFLLITFLSLFATVAFGADNSILRLPAGMKVATATPTLSSHAIMSCDLYNIHLQDGYIQSSEKLATFTTQPFTVGNGNFIRVQFPTPFHEISVVFNHILLGYFESGNEDNTPYVQTFFMKGTQFISGVKDASFDMTESKPGAKILLRDSYQFDEKSMLTYQCSFTSAQ